MSDTNDLKRDIVELSIESFVKEVVSLTKDGWAVCKSNPGDAIGFGNAYTVSMYRNEATIQAFKEVAEAVVLAPKMTRAESLQKARAAKGGKLDVTQINQGE